MQWLNHLLPMMVREMSLTTHYPVPFLHPPTSCTIYDCWTTLPGSSIFNQEFEPKFVFMMQMIRERVILQNSFEAEADLSLLRYHASRLFIILTPGPVDMCTSVKCLDLKTPRKPLFGVWPVQALSKIPAGRKTYTLKCLENTWRAFIKADVYSTRCDARSHAYLFDRAARLLFVMMSGFACHHIF